MFLNPHNQSSCRTISPTPSEPTLSSGTFVQQTLATEKKDSLSSKYIDDYQQTLALLIDIAKVNDYELTESVELFQNSFLDLKSGDGFELKLHCFTGKRVVDDLIGFLQRDDVLPGCKREVLDEVKQYLSEKSDKALAHLYRYNCNLLQSSDGPVKQVQAAQYLATRALIKEYVMSQHQCADANVDQYVNCYMDKVVKGADEQMASSEAHKIHAPVSSEQLLKAAEFLSDNLTNTLVVKHLLKTTLNSVDQSINQYLGLTTHKHEYAEGLCKIEKASYIQTNDLMKPNSSLEMEIKTIFDKLQAQLKCDDDEPLYQLTELFQGDEYSLIWPNTHPLIERRVLNLLEEKGVFPVSEDRQVVNLGSEQVRQKDGIVYVISDGQCRHLSSKDIQKAHAEKLLNQLSASERRLLVNAAIETAGTFAEFVDFAPDLLLYTGSWPAFMKHIVDPSLETSQSKVLLQYLQHYRPALTHCFKQDLSLKHVSHNPEGICDRNAIRQFRQLLLNQAFSETDNQLLGVLLGLGISPNTRLDNGKTLVMQTVVLKEANLDRLHLLLHHKPELNLADHVEQKTATMLAAEVGRADMLDALLQYDVSNIESVDANKETALVLAARYNNIDCIDTLIKHKAVTDHLDLGNVTTPLMAAISEKNHEAILKLLDYGADVNRINNQGRTPLMMAALHPELAQGEHLILTRLIKKGAKVNDVDAQGATALMYAARKDNVDALVILKTEGANIEIEGNASIGHQNALGIAVFYAHEASVEKLISFGASVDRPGLRESTQIAQLAKSSGNPEIIKMVDAQKSGVPHRRWHYI
jgi:ankyrin repeat protein